MAVKIMIVFGTRPEAIKMAPVVKELQQHPEVFSPTVCVTAQHRQMHDQVLRLFQINPDYDLNIMMQGQDLFDITCSVLQGLKPVLERVRPAIVLVHGDTTTTMAAALASYYANIPVGYVEAGLRTHNKYAPFPEEINRRLAGVLTDLHFAPTEAARRNLLCEGIPGETIHVTGNTVVDALLTTTDRIRSNPEASVGLEREYSFLNPAKRLILVTGHRRENFGDGIDNICRSLARIAGCRDDVEILYPVHLNPNEREPVQRILGRGGTLQQYTPHGSDRLSSLRLPHEPLISHDYRFWRNPGGCALTRQACAGHAIYH